MFNTTHNGGIVGEDDRASGDLPLRFKRKNSIYIYGRLEIPYTAFSWTRKMHDHDFDNYKKKSIIELFCNHTVRDAHGWFKWDSCSVSCLPYFLIVMLILKSH